MVKYSATRLDQTFSALADPTRRAILAQLAAGQTSVSQLASRFDISLPGVTKHLRVLERAGLLATEKRGRVRRCRLVPAPMRDAAEWIAFYKQFWEQQLDSLAQYFENLNEKEKQTCPPHNLSQNIHSKSDAPSRRPSKRSSTRSRSRKSWSDGSLAAPSRTRS